MFMDDLVELNNDVILAIRNLRDRGYTDSQISIYLNVSVCEIIKIK